MSKLLARQDLRKYQIRFLNIIKRKRAVILALPMGGGKTVSTLTAALDLLDDKVVNKVLIVAPLLVATATWPDEIEQWEHTSLLSWTLIRAEDTDRDIIKARKSAYNYARKVIGMDAKSAQSFAGKKATKAKEWKRRRLASEDTEVHIINKDALPWLWDFFGEGERWPYDMLVYDEASMFKNGNMRTEKKELTRFGVAARARKYATRIVELTGTPAPKGLQNLWGLAFVADGGKRLGTSKFWFEKRWFEKDNYGYKIEPRPKAFEQITSRLKDIMFSMREEDCVTLPKLNNIPRKVTLPPRILESYKEFEETLFSEAYDIEAVNRGVLHNKLLQFANGSMYNEEGDVVHIHDEKLHALEDIISEANRDPVLIAYTFKFDLEKITKRFKKAVVFGRGDVRRQKAAWNAGDIEIMLAHPQSVGHGQNLQFGGHISVWYGLTSDLEIYQQFNKRLHRSGQKYPVFNHHLVAKGTHDEKMLPILTRRGATQDEIIDTVLVNMN